MRAIGRQLTGALVASCRVHLPVVAKFEVLDISKTLIIPPQFAQIVRQYRHYHEIYFGLKLHYVNRDTSIRSSSQPFSPTVIVIVS